jgi:pseudaminic acid cytidylyltransferase
MKNLAIIPARGGSKRIPRKNVKPFLGKPIIAYSIEAALNSELFEEIIVSTDDIEIAEIAIKYGARVPFMRSSENSDDYASTFSVIEEVILNIEKNVIKYDNICCIYACAPFVSGKKLIEGYNKFKGNNYDSLFPILPFDFPIQRGLEIQNEKLKFIQEEFSLVRSQDLTPYFHDAGQFYWLNKATCLRKKMMITDNTGYILISELEGQDIDNENDWRLAELKYEVLQSNK